MTVDCPRVRGRCAPHRACMYGHAVSVPKLCKVSKGKLWPFLCGPLFVRQRSRVYGTGVFFTDSCRHKRFHCLFCVRLQRGIMAFLLRASFLGVGTHAFTVQACFLRTHLFQCLFCVGFQRGNYGILYEVLFFVRQRSRACGTDLLFTDPCRHMRFMGLFCARFQG